MSSRHRHSTARPTPSRPSVAPTPSRNIADELPPYKKPSHPLDNDAQRAIAALQGRTDLKKHSVHAVTTINSAAENINDMLRVHTEYIARRRKKWDAGKSLATKEEEEREMQELQEKVNDATEELEQSMRAVIDSGVAAQRIEDALEWLRQNAPVQLEQEYQTQMTQRATQRQSQTQRHNADGDEDVDEGSAPTPGPTPGPTPLDGSRVALTGASELYTDRMQRKKDDYTSLSLIARYARNNDYRSFKGIVHDAMYGDSGPTLGHEDTWFTDTGSPAPGVTDTRRSAFEDDDDIIVDKVKMSTTCPITFQQYKDPITSTKCPHTFEKNAILDMIRNSMNRVGGGGQRGVGERAIECPCTGCSQVPTYL